MEIFKYIQAVFYRVVGRSVVSPVVALENRQNAIAEYQHDLRVVRSAKVKAGLVRARRRGIRLGRPRVHTNIALVIGMRQQGCSIRTIVADTGYSHGTVQRILERYKIGGGHAQA